MLAWNLIENARLIYEENGGFPTILASLYETLGEINTEQANFQAALEAGVYERCMRGVIGVCKRCTIDVLWYMRGV